jgi:PleD family two-component response regulator
VGFRQVHDKRRIGQRHFDLVDASVGLAEWHPGETMEEVIEEADAAMYRNKKDSRK